MNKINHFVELQVSISVLQVHLWSDVKNYHNLSDSKLKFKSDDGVLTVIMVDK